MFTLFNSLHCCSLICPANHHSRRAKTLHGEMLSWTPWDCSGLESCFHHWEAALLKIPGGNTKGLWNKRLNNNTWKEWREICSVPYGKFKMCQVVKDDIPIFFIEASRGRCNGNRWTEGHIFHQVGFLCVALIVCVCIRCLSICCMKRLPVMLLYAMHLVFHRQKNSITNCNEALIKARFGLRRVQCMFEFDREGLKDC